MEDILLIQEINGNKLTVVTRDIKKFDVFMQEGCIWDQFLPQLQKFDQIYLDRNSIKQKEISDESIFVLDPHYLVPVTSVGKAYDCPRKVYVSHMGADEFDNMERIVQGNLLHDVFSQKVALQIPVNEAIDNVLEASEVQIITNGLKHADLEEYLQKNARVFNTINVKGESEIDFENWRFGMHGKLDAKINDMIIELKSSKIPDEKPYFSHNLQMNMYLYLLREKEENIGKIFYVNEGRMKMLDPTNLTFRRMIVARNYTYLVTTGRYIPPLLRGEEAKECKRCFVRAGCQKLCAGTGFQRDCERCDMVDICNKQIWDQNELEYFSRMVESIDAEQNISTREKYKYSRAGTPAEKEIDHLVKSGYAIITEKKKSVEVTPHGVITIYRHKSKETIFRKGDFVNGYPQINRHDVVTNYYGLTIRNITDDELEVLSVNHLPEVVCIVPSETSGIYRRSRGAVFRATQLNDKLMKIIKTSLKSKISQKELEWEKVELLNPLKDYNPYQERAIKSALITEDILLVQGPAGTGKTSVIVEIIHQLHKKGKSVLASAFTNMAVDNIGIKLKEYGIPFTRLGREQSVSSELKDFLPKDPAAFSGVFLQLEPTIILATTTAVAGDQYRDLVFDYTVIDEAAQMTEPDTLKPMLLSRRAILVGDHKQLPPVIRSEVALKNEYDISMFERLKDRVAPDHFIILLSQYRMNDEILSFPNKLFYHGQLTTALNKIKEQTIEMEKSTFLPSNPYLVFNINSPYRKQDKRSNSQEAWLTTLIVIELLKKTKGLRKEDIGIITPFRAQVSLLRKMLPGLSIDTVDRYQGSEREIIIFSTITARQVPIVTDDRRINVALTRAKKKLIVLVTNPNSQQASLCDTIVEDAAKRKLAYDVDGTKTDIKSFISQFTDYSDFETNFFNFFKPINLSDISVNEYDSVVTSPMISIYMGKSPLPTGVFSEIANSEELNGCSICYSEFKKSDKTVMCFGCTYYFHFEHLVEALRTVPYCPICRSDLHLV